MSNQACRKDTACAEDIKLTSAENTKGFFFLDPDQCFVETFSFPAKLDTVLNRAQTTQQSIKPA